MNVNDSWIAAEVFEIKRQTPTFFSIQLAFQEEETQFHFQTGQCVNLLTPLGQKACFSIASEPEEKKFIEFLMKDQPGTAAHEICQMSVGNKIKISSPFGKGFPVERFKTKNLFLVGIGSGLSPLRSLLKSLIRRDHQFQEITLLYGARNQDEIPFRSEFDLWSKKIKVHIALSQPHGHDWNGFKGRVTHLISKLDIHLENTICCICGNKTMEEEVRKSLERRDVSKQNMLFNY